MNFKARKVCLLLGFILALAEFSFGQNILSSIVGQITDTTGAAIPSVQIVITNQGTGISVEAITDSAGTYSVPNLYAGVYEIQGKKEGFEVVRITGIHVLAAQSVRQDVVMKVGSFNQSVTVTGEAPLVHPDSTNIAGEISTRQLSELPVTLQSVDGFMIVIPGPRMGSGGWQNPGFGGSQELGGTNFNINGISANDQTNGRGLQGYGTGLVALPPLSSMQEFKVDVTNMSAEYQMQSSVSIVTKQGSNKFHGEAYAYNRNAALEANTFVLNAAGQRRAPYNLNQFGGNLGGPIWKNKAFFFFNFSGFRQRQYSTAQLNFPTQAMQQGNFGALCASYGVNGVCSATGGTQLYNPGTGAAFPNNQIPANLITSQAKTLVTYLPQLTTPGSLGLPNAAPNYVGSVAVIKDFDAYDSRLDWQISAKDSLTGFFTHNYGFPWVQPAGSPPNYGNGSNYGYETVEYHIAEAHTFNSNTLNDIRIGWLNYPQDRSGQNLNFDPTSLFPQQQESAQRGLPVMNFTGYGRIGDLGSRHLSSYQPSMQILENFTHVHGRHTLKAGADLNDFQWYQQSSYASLPAFSFKGVWTGNKGNPGQPQSQGNAFADFLLGDATSSSTSYLGHDVKYYDKDWELYFQDTWQATNKLTVYLGVRYMNQMPWTLRDNLWGTWNLPTNQLVIPQNSNTPTLGFGMAPQLFNGFLSHITTTKALGLPLNFVKDDSNNWGPRVGFAFRPFANGKTVLRGGYGVFYAFNSGEYMPIDLTLDPPFAGGTSGAISSALNFTTALPGAPTSQFLPDITFSNPFPSSLGGLGGAPTNPGLSPTQYNYALPVEQSWNLTVERQIGVSNMVRVSYLGSQTHHMLWNEEDVNIPTVQTPNMPIQSQRPYQPWASITVNDSGAKQNYNELELEYIRHFAKGLSAQAEYSWTQALTNDENEGGGNPQEPAYPKLNYGYNAQIPRHKLMFNYIYSLPVGRGRRYVSNAGGVVDDLLGGWQVSGITNYFTGTPLSVFFQVPSNYVGWWGGQANRVSGVPLYAKQSGHDITDGVQWFNPSAFAPPQPWQWGNSEAFSVWGPGAGNWDMSLQKNFRIPIRGLETPRLTFRADFFDVFNHFNLAGNPGATIADTRDGGSPIPTAGKLYGGSDNRTIQLGLKFEF